MFSFRVGMVAAAAMAAGLFLQGNAARAQETVSAANPDELLSVLRGFGSARLGEDSLGDPKIDGRTDGEEYTVLFYGCTDGKDCRSIAFWSYWVEEIPLERVNEWNKEERYGKLYIDQDGDLALEYDVNLAYGMDVRTFEDSAEIWVGLVADVKNNVLPD